MKACVVPVSAVESLFLRLDTRPYMEAAWETPGIMREKLRTKIKASWRRQARKGLAHIRSMEKWNREHRLDGVEKMGP